MVKLKWLKEPVKTASATWGVPWRRGLLKNTEDIKLYGETGNQYGCDTSAAAFWPDGSIKWTFHSACFNGIEKNYYLKQEKYTDAKSGIIVEESIDKIFVKTSKLSIVVNKKGEEIINEIYLGDKKICSGGKLVCLNNDAEFTGAIDEVKTQTGKNRVCVVIKGRHIRGGRRWLPFTLRLYIYDGAETIRALHTFAFDGNPHTDFINGLGIVFAVPLENDELYNRHIRLGCDEGFFCDSPKNLDTWRTRGKYADVLRAQINGDTVCFDTEQDGGFVELLNESPVWNDFKLLQESPDSFAVYKRTKEGCSYIKALNGSRAMGIMYAGGVSGGIAVGLKDFWQKYPSCFEVNNMSKSETMLKVWLWPPDAKPMDLRHYDTETHVQSSYEGFDEMRATPYGIANTNEFTINLFESTPSHEMLKLAAESTQEKPMLVCEPEYYHETGAFGVWSLKESSGGKRILLEDQLEHILKFIENEIEQWKWYGFWDYGDMMRQYDAVRHTWKYDVGGLAWNNNEFDPNILLWLMFLRNGRNDTFRLAEAFTRHASEVDQYHFGEYRGLGSRHNVMHWGCGCKEARISMAAIHKFYYYLAGDERTGDILDEVKDVEHMLLSLDPMRAYFPAGVYPTHARVSPDWAALTANWMTAYERTLDNVYLQKIKKGIECLKKMPNRLCSGPTYGFDPATSELIYMSDNNTSFHMCNCFGAPLVWIELASWLGDEIWKEMLAEYGDFYYLEDEKKLEKRSDMDEKGLRQWRMPESAYAFGAYAAFYNNDEALASKIWDAVLSTANYLEEKEISSLACPKMLKEYEGANSGVALRGISLIICFELIGKYLKG